MIQHPHKGASGDSQRSAIIIGAGIAGLTIAPEHDVLLHGPASVVASRVSLSSLPTFSVVLTRDSSPIN